MEEQKTAAADPAGVEAHVGKETGTVPETKKDSGAGENPMKQEATAAGGETYDQSYIDKLLEQQKQAQEAAVAEALRVAGMDAESKARYEKEQEAKKLADREAEIMRRELKAEAREILAGKEIPAEFLDMLLGVDMKETAKNVETFKAKFDAAVQAQVEKRLVGKTPQSGNEAMSESMTVEAEIDRYL